MLADDAHLDCSAVNEVIARYVDISVSGAESEQELLGLDTHIEECPPCTELYNTLCELSRLEEAGCLPDLDELFEALRLLQLAADSDTVAAQTAA